jgi:non-ribosomal peptide synthetase component E (peptide arylation enzyme)
MKTLDELFNQTDYEDAAALRAPGRGEQVYTYERLRETVSETATLFHEMGIDSDSRVAIAAHPTAYPVFAFYAAGLLGATTWVGPPQRVNAHVAVAPSDMVVGYQLPDGAARIGYGETPDDDDVLHFERAIWNTEAEHPTLDVLPGTKAITDGEWKFSHRNLLEAAKDVAERLDEDTTVSVRADLSNPCAIAGGIVAPLLVGGTIRFPDTAAQPTGDVAITDEEAPEPRSIPVQSIPLE